MDDETAQESARQRRWRELLVEAYDEVVAAILSKLEGGGKPSRVSRYPTFSLRENGMPSLSDGAFTGAGPLEYSSLLDPPYSDHEARRLGKFPPARFPAVARLVAFSCEYPEIARIPGPSSDAENPIVKVAIELLVARAADVHFLRFGETPVTAATRTVVLKPLFNGSFDARLNLAVLAPIALARFDFGRMRLGPSAFIMRMSPDLQRARWEMKAYGANGHDQVLAAATHAFVLTGWDIPNGNWNELDQTLSNFSSDVRERIDALFAALRIETGIETGYAQEVRLARGWRHRHNYGLPDVYAVGARRYPEVFDDFGWNRGNLPLVTKAQMREVARLFEALEQSPGERLALATRRLNTAMTRSDFADAILDATIALEVLLGDGDGQAISWKLRMRAAALAGIEEGQAGGKAMNDAISKVYATRSAIVHGARRRGAPNAHAERDLAAKEQSLDVLRRMLKILIQRPEFLDLHRIDSDLLMAPPAAVSGT
ncbi:hypothetical protein IVB18_42915 [Bradyrhizobium sp. 186]|uniref:HEPN domain-containing protein n=1 Tax=Bradyrhizobium sp. 186 TaxID=2782654 RepID=UPI0020010A31|nr:HEPN domain-containing protein [Bradyrhizobium sp. 186]UPK34687.1 hypothetical protein IVB18_42915 [Bradyrhizobium sp. 186]